MLTNEQIAAALMTIAGDPDMLAGDRHFADSLVSYWNRKRTFTERQASAAGRLIQRVSSPKATAVPKRDCIARIVDMFKQSKAVSPSYRSIELTITTADEKSMNPGWLYVKETKSGEYLGKINPTLSEFKPAPSHHNDDFTWMFDEMDRILESPYEVAVEYGREYKSCSNCGRALSNPISKELGIGPICRGYWGWGPMVAIEEVEVTPLDMETFGK